MYDFLKFTFAMSLTPVAVSDFNVFKRAAEINKKRTKFYRNAQKLIQNVIYLFSSIYKRLDTRMYDCFASKFKLIK